MKALVYLTAITTILIASTEIGHATNRVHRNYVNFSSDTIESGTNFNADYFRSDVTFYDAHFKGSADFAYATFDSLADFIITRFASIANFERTNFNSLAQFYGATFDSLADFSHAIFNSNVSFDRVKFLDNASFNRCSFKNASFEKTRFSDTVFFQNVSISGLVDFSKIEMDSVPKLIYINIEGSDIKNIRLDYTKFRLFFSNNNYTNEKDRIYTDLKSNLNKNSFEYQLLDIEQKELRYSGSFGASFVGFIDKRWWNYGYNKELIVTNTLIVFVFFWIINTLLFSFLNESIYEIPGIWNVMKTISKKRVVMLPFYSFWYTCLIFFGLKITLERLNYHNKLGVVYFYIQFVSGLVFVATLANIVIKS